MTFSYVLFYDWYFCFFVWKTLPSKARVTRDEVSGWCGDDTKLCLKGNTISTTFSSFSLKKAWLFSVNIVPLWFYSILCARLRLARGKGLGRSVLNNPQTIANLFNWILAASNFHDCYFWIIYCYLSHFPYYHYK